MTKVKYGGKSPRKIEKGDLVAYTSGHHGDSEENPLWNGRFGRTRGKVTSVSGDTAEEHELIIRVYWSAFDTTNIYSVSDLSVIAKAKNNFVKPDPGPEIKIKGLFNVGG